MTWAIVVSLMVNAVGAFLIAAGIVLLYMRVVRPKSSRLVVALLTLPFVKLVYELARGLPSSAFLWTDGVVPETRSVLVGAGFTAPFALRLHIVMRALADGREYVLSLGDVVVDACRTTSPLCLPLLSAILCLPAAILVLRRVACFIAFERVRRTEQARATTVTHVGRGCRRIAVYEADAHCGVPFSGGLLRPYVCIPSRISKVLSTEERAAVVEHELAHIRHFDVLILAFVGIVTDVFWFVPGVRSLGRRVAQACELAADDAASRNGAGPAMLASALVRVAGALREERLRMPVTAAGRDRHHLQSRVRRLLDGRVIIATGRNRVILRTIAAWIGFAVAAQTVLMSALGGAH